MTPSQIRNEVSSFVGTLLEQGLVIDSNSTVVRRQGSTAYVVWSSAPRDFVRFPFPAELFATAAEYRMLLEERQYNCLLFDGSYLQACYEFRHGDLTKYRLCYYPCPIRLPDLGPLYSDNLGDIFDEYMVQVFDDLEWVKYAQNPAQRSDSEEAAKTLEEMPRLRLRSPVRFDYDIDAQGPSHPASHVHISDSECRVPVYAPLSFGHFARFVFRHFYSAEWHEHEFLQTWPVQMPSRSIALAEEAQLHFECRHISAE
jgi:hypothetical protein